MREDKRTCTVHCLTRSLKIEVEVSQRVTREQTELRAQRGARAPRLESQSLCCTPEMPRRAPRHMVVERPRSGSLCGDPSRDRKPGSHVVAAQKLQEPRRTPRVAEHNNALQQLPPSPRRTREQQAVPASSPAAEEPGTADKAPPRPHRTSPARNTPKDNAAGSKSAAAKTKAVSDTPGRKVGLENPVKNGATLQERKQNKKADLKGNPVNTASRAVKEGTVKGVPRKPGGVTLRLQQGAAPPITPRPQQGAAPPVTTRPITAHRATPSDVHYSDDFDDSAASDSEEGSCYCL